MLFLRPFKEVPVSLAHGPSIRWPALPPFALTVESRTTVWRMDHRVGALPILFMLTAETEAVGYFNFGAAQKQKTHRRGRRWIRVDALGDFRFVPALTKLSSKRAENPIYNGPAIQLLNEDSGSVPICQSARASRSLRDNCGTCIPARA